MATFNLELFKITISHDFTDNREDLLVYYIL